MKKSDFYFDLPEALIAQYPLPNRSDSRLLCYRRKDKSTQHQQFRDLSELLNPGDLLVMNNTKVIPARFYGKKESGGRVECLVERMVESHVFLAHIKASKAPKAGSLIILDKGFSIEIIEKQDDLYLCISLTPIEILLENLGHIPLPPYIHREDESMDSTRYQTVYAEHKGSVAAPTAGLHFDKPLLEQLRKKGVETDWLTLHVGSGTFRPLRCEAIVDHKMHAERFVLSEALCEKIKRTKANGHRVIAVGTTVLRSLESAFHNGELKAGARETDIFIYPGFDFKVCDGLVTNFHLPESTLLILVAAFIGYEAAMGLYQTAIREGYRFFSYGDASLLL